MEWESIAGREGEGENDKQVIFSLSDVINYNWPAIDVIVRMPGLRLDIIKVLTLNSLVKPLKPNDAEGIQLLCLHQ